MTPLRDVVRRVVHETPGILETSIVALLVITGLLWGVAVLQLFLWAAFGWAFLLRTPRSTVMAIRLSIPALIAFRQFFSRSGREAGSVTRIDDFVFKSSDSWTARASKVVLFFPLVLVLSAFVLPFLLIAFVAVIVLLVAYIGVCRVLATTWCALRHPNEAFRAMPRAWRRTLRQTSLATTWELVPGLARFHRLARRTAWAGGIGVDHPLELARNGFSRTDVKRLMIAFAAALTLAGGVALARYVSTHAFQLYPSKGDYTTMADSIPVARVEAFMDAMKSGMDADELLPHLRDEDALSADNQREMFERLRDALKGNGSVDEQRQITTTRMLLASAEMPVERIRYERAKLLSKIDPSQPFGMVILLSLLIYTYVPLQIPEVAAFLVTLLGTAAIVAPWSVALSALLYAVAGMFRSPLRLVLYAPSLAYRLAMKAACILYFPMIWVSEPKYLRFDQPRVLIEDAALHPYTAMGAVGGVFGIGAWVAKQILAQLSTFTSNVLPDTAAAGYFYKPHVYDFLMLASALFAIWFWLRARLLERQAEVDMRDARRLVMLGRVKSMFAIYSLLVFVVGAWPHLSSITIVFPEGGWLPTVTILGQSEK